MATGDSLLHGRRFDQLNVGGAAFHSKADGVRHFGHAEDAEAVERILGRQYHVVAGNPPYITPKDPALNQAYRERYPTTCHMKYALAVPFIERFFDLALANGKSPAGFVGMIVAKSFMKREFGKKLIEQFFPSVDLTHVCDTAGAYIPGHGTPTAILFGRHRKPMAGEVRTVMGIKGEPQAPADPAKGEVWSAILRQIDHAGSQSSYVSVADTPRATFAKHPWSLGGGGAAELKETLECQSDKTLSQATGLVGVFGMTNADEVMLADQRSFLRQGLKTIRRLVIGDEVRDWTEREGNYSYFSYEQKLLPISYEQKLLPIADDAQALKWLWPARTVLGTRATFSKKTYFAEGRPWWEWHQIVLDRVKTPLSITFAEVATHNHFVLDRGGKVFKQTAPVIKLPPGSSEDDHLALLGLLNSSTGCFWFKQVGFNKGDSTDAQGARTTGEFSFDTFVFNATQVGRFPLVEPYPTDLARALDELGHALTAALPKAVLARGVPTRADLDEVCKQALAIRRRMIALQEELDWRCYRLYGLVDENLVHPNPPEIDLGERAFEIVMARRAAAGDLETTWFERHGSTPITAIPSRWPADYRALVERRIATIAECKWIRA